jgi:tetratricopeptide (TPR) repeat protein
VLAALLVLLAAASAMAQGSTPARGQAGAKKAAPVAQPKGVQDAARALSAGDVERALQLAGAQLKADPASVGARLVMARAHIARDEYPAAYEHLRAALRGHPKNVDVLYYLGIVAGRLAGEELERLVTVAPSSPRVQQVLAETLDLQGRRHEAAAAYAKALELQPDLFEALLGLAKLRRTSLECAEAIELYRRAERLQPTFEGAYGLGVCLQYEQDDEGAAAQFTAATARDPKDPLAWQGLGIAEMKLGRVPRAIEHLQRALALQPDMYEAHYALGQAYRTAGDLDKAKAAFATAQQLQQQRRGTGALESPAQPPR